MINIKIKFTGGSYGQTLSNRNGFLLRSAAGDGGRAGSCRPAPACTYANYLDGREIGFHDFFNRIASGEKATTSAVNVEEFKVVMEQKLQEGLDILFIGFSSGLSTTYQSGAIACQELQ